jgi:hypothetical protein
VLKHTKYSETKPNKSRRYNGILIGKYETNGTSWKIYIDGMIILEWIIEKWAVKL